MRAARHVLGLRSLPGKLTGHTKVHRFLPASQTRFMPMRSIAFTRVSCRKFINMESVRQLPGFEERLFRPERFRSEIETNQLPLNPAVLTFWNVSCQSDLSPLEDERYESMISDVVENAPVLSDSDILAALSSIQRFPFSSSPRAPRFQKLWKSLDQKCIERARGTAEDRWSIDYMLLVSDAWSFLLFDHLLEFQWYSKNRCARSSNYLNKEQYLHFLMLVITLKSVSKKVVGLPVVDTFKRLFPEMNSVEVSLVAQTFNVLDVELTDQDLICQIMKKTMQDADSLEDWSVLNVARMISKGARLGCEETMLEMMRAFTPEVDRLTLWACIWLIYMGAQNTRVLEHSLMTAVLSKVENQLDLLLPRAIRYLVGSVAQLRVTDCDSLLEKVVQYLSNLPEEEFYTYGKTITETVQFLTYKEIYSDELLDRVLSQPFYKKVFSKADRKYAIPLIKLDLGVGIERPDYTGNRLSPKLLEHLLKSNWPKPLNVSSSRTTVIVTVSLLKVLQGISEASARITTLLPQWRRYYVLFCSDKDGNPVEIPTEFAELPEFHTKVLPPSSPVVFHAFAPTSAYNCVYGGQLSGSSITQRRLLRKLGYVVHSVDCDSWNELREEERVRFCTERIRLRASEDKKMSDNFPGASSAAAS